MTRIFTTCIFLTVLLLSCNNREDKPYVENGKNDGRPGINKESSVNPYATVDISPMDMSYFPVEYPKLKMAKEMDRPPMAKVIYSRPLLQGRTLFKDLLRYEEPWRLGANEATELILYQDATIQDKRIKAGRYVMYAIPHPDTWTIVLNTNIDTWGLQQDTAQDIARFNVPVKKTNRRLEFYTMVFENIEGGANLLMAWDNMEARLPIYF